MPVQLIHFCRSGQDVHLKACPRDRDPELNLWKVLERLRRDGRRAFRSKLGSGSVPPVLSPLTHQFSTLGQILLSQSIKLYTMFMLYKLYLPPHLRLNRLSS